MRTSELTAADIIRILDLKPLPVEGGYYSSDLPRRFATAQRAIALFNQVGPGGGVGHLLHADCRHEVPLAPSRN